MSVSFFLEIISQNKSYLQIEKPRKKKGTEEMIRTTTANTSPYERSQGKKNASIFFHVKFYLITFIYSASQYFSEAFAKGSYQIDFHQSYVFFFEEYIRVYPDHFLQV